MNKEIKDLWVKALRSGEYKQTKGKLKDSNGYCCLGVLCELSNIGSFEKEVDNISRYVIDDKCYRELLPSSVQKWAGMTSNDGKIDDDDNLSGLNDGGIRFKEIADIIEEKWIIL